jgi:hypothetical protein
MNGTLKGIVLATAASGMFLSAGFAAASPAAEGAGERIHCEGVNSCKGKGDCSGGNSCQGQNSCKGQGFLSLTKEQCDAKKAELTAQG